MSRTAMWTWRAGILVAFLVFWQYAPKIDALSSRVDFLDPFFISSPTLVCRRLWEILTGSNGQTLVWPLLKNTLIGTAAGTPAGLVLGAIAGLILSNSDRLSRVLSIYVVAINSVPRIALIPIVVLITGPTLAASIFSAVIVIFFLAFYNAFEGGRSVPQPVLQNARLLGASETDIVRRVRLPYVLIWTFAVVPNAISFGLVAVVTTELLTGSPGMGSLILSAITNVDASLSFAVVVLLSLVGMALYAGAEALKKKVLHWTG